MFFVRVILYGKKGSLRWVRQKFTSLNPIAFKKWPVGSDKVKYDNCRVHTWVQPPASEKDMPLKNPKLQLWNKNKNENNSLKKMFIKALKVSIRKK